MVRNQFRNFTLHKRRWLGRQALQDIACRGKSSIKKALHHALPADLNDRITRYLRHFPHEK
jgi:hypothetical protein